MLPGNCTVRSNVASQRVIDGMRRLGAEVTTCGYQCKGGKQESNPNELCAAVRNIETRDAGLGIMLWSMSAIMRRWYHSTAKYRSLTFIAQVRSLLASAEFHLVVIDHARLACVLPALPLHIRVVALLHSIEHEVYQSFSNGRSPRPWSRWRDRRDARLVQRLELELAQRADEIWAFTDHDAAFFTTLCDGRPSRVLTLPGAIRPDAAVSRKTCDVALTADWTSQASMDALQWFLTQIYPKLPPSLSIQIAGKGADRLARRHRNIVCRGELSDTQEFLAQARVIAIPTLNDGGIDVHTLDIIAGGARVVATPTALRGVATPPSTVTAAGDPTIFAERLVAAIQAPDSNAECSQTAHWTAQRTRRFASTLSAGLGLSPQRSSLQLEELASS